MNTQPSGIRFLHGSKDILVIAPHGPYINGEYLNDVRTGILAEEIHKELGCYTIINDRYFKPKGEIAKNAALYYLDVFRIDHAQKVEGYLNTIKEVVNGNSATVVIWLHGIADDVALDQGTEHAAHGLFNLPPSSLHALIGYGQGPDPKTGGLESMFTATEKTVTDLCKLLTSHGMTTIPTYRESTNFRGRDSKRLNQWFRQRSYSLDNVESLQLEIREKDFRDTDKNAIRAGHVIAKALRELIRE